ncbi:MAG: HAMP domain-containing protein, partial [Oscillospiraceae bacterium]|nr:HAMP domain-containing protein [Oscillospiraceae bacterium]
MWAITSKGNKKVRFTRRVQFKFALTYIALIVALLLLLNTYPLLESRDLMFSAKESALRGQALGVSRELSGRDRLERETVGHEMGFLDIGHLSRVVVTDAAGVTIYDTADGEADITQHALFDAELVYALWGYDLFYISLSGGSFYSWAASPLMGGDGQVIGAVYIHEQDFAQGQLIVDIQRNLQNISIGVFVVAVILAIVFSRTLTRRLMAMLAAIRRVGAGEYDYKLAIRGQDEVAELGQAFNTLTDRLYETEAMRRRFVSDASHELKTPLASIRLLSDSIVQNEQMDE